MRILITCPNCKLCGLEPLAPLLADDSLDNIETVSLNAESLSGESVRMESVFSIISLSPGSSFSLWPSEDDLLCVLDRCWDIFCESVKNVMLGTETYKNVV